MASLVLYGSSVLDTGGLGTASKMSTTTGGTETSKKTTITGVGPTYAEITSQGLTVADVASIPATPTSRGWIYYPGAGTFDIGNWSAAITLAFVLHGAPNTTLLRAFRYSSGSYTLIGSISAVTATLAKTTYAFAPTSFGSITFGASDGLYFDLWWHDSSSDPSGDNPTVYVSNSATAGVANDFVVTTSNFTPGGGGGGGGSSVVSGKLPSTSVTNGVSDSLFSFDTNAQPQMSVPNPTSGMFATANALGYPSGMMMRTFISDVATDAQINNRLNTIANLNGIPYICLQSPLDATFNKHVVSFVGSRCNIYQFGNEPGNTEPMTSTQYINAWNAQIPTLRGLNPNAAFIGAHTTFRTTWLDACVTSGVIPDGVEFHKYACHGSSTSTVCLTHTGDYGTEVNTMRGELQARWPGLYQNIAIGCGEYNVDWASPQVSYAQDEPFITTYLTQVIQSMITAGADYACFFGLFGNGTNFNMINDSSGATVEFYTAFKAMIASLYSPATPSLALSCRMSGAGRLTATLGGNPMTLSCTMAGAGTITATLGSTWPYLGQYTVFIGRQLV